MMHKKIILQMLFLLMVLSASAQSDYPVSYTLQHPDTVQSGSSFEIRVQFAVKDGWYIYAPTGNNAAQGFIETKVIFNVPEGVKRDGKMNIPEPKFKIGHEVFLGDRIVFSQQFTVGNEVPMGTYTIQAKITYQTCNDYICLPPVTETVPITIKVKKH